MLKKLTTTTFLIVVLFGCSVSYAQTKDYPWSVGVGLNFVDFYPNGEATDPVYEGSATSDALFSQFFNSTEHYNGSLMSLRLSVGRYLWKGFSLEASLAYNEISEFGTLDVEDYLEPRPLDENGGRDYVALDASLNYSFRDLIQPRGDGWADPFVGLGGGITWVEEPTGDLKGAGNFDASIGLAIWVSRRVSIVYKSTFKYIPYELAHRDFTHSHFQHSLGVKYVFDFKRSTCYEF